MRKDSCTHGVPTLRRTNEASARTNERTGRVAEAVGRSDANRVVRSEDAIVVVASEADGNRSTGRASVGCPTVRRRGFVERMRVAP